MGFASVAAWGESHVRTLASSGAGRSADRRQGRPCTSCRSTRTSATYPIRLSSYTTTNGGHVLAEAFFQLGRGMVKDLPPKGREYFAARVWNPTRYDKSSLGGPEIADNERRIIELIERYGEGAQRTLEFGCGPGIYVEAAVKHTAAPEVIGVDVSPGALEASRKRVNDPRLRLVHGDF